MQEIRGLFGAYPPVDEQERIAEYISRETAKLDTLVEKSRRSIELMREHRTALIWAAVTGKIDVRGCSAYNGHNSYFGSPLMKTLSARDAKNRFGEFLDMARREPVLVTKNDRPVGIFLSIEDAAETLVPERFMAAEPGYDAWLVDKVGATLQKVASGETRLHDHDAAMVALSERIAALRAKT